MSCAIFDPNLPFDTSDQQATWVSQWNSNVLNSLCLQLSCAMPCLTNGANSKACMSCLDTHGCVATLSCMQCVGTDANLKDFTTVFNCTIFSLWPFWKIFVVVISVLVGFVLFFFLIIMFLYWSSSGVLKPSTRVWIRKNIIRDKSELSPQEILDTTQEQFNDKQTMHRMKLKRYVD